MKVSIVFRQWEYRVATVDAPDGLNLDDIGAVLKALDESGLVGRFEWADDGSREIVLAKEVTE